MTEPLMRLGRVLRWGLLMAVTGSDDEGSSSGHAVELSYGELLSLVNERIVSEAGSEPLAPEADAKRAAAALVKRRSAAKIAIELFMVANGLDEGSSVGPEMTGTGYDEALRRLGEYDSESLAKRKSAKAKLNSFIRQYAIQAVFATVEVDESESFSQTLTRLMRKRDVGCRTLAAAISRSGESVDPSVVEAWRSGKRIPTGGRSHARISTMEKALKVPPGTLMARLPREAAHAESAPFGGTRSEQRKYSFFLEGVPKEKHREAIAWLEREVFTAPVEVFNEDGGLIRDPYALALRDEKPGRRRVASEALTAEVRALEKHKTEVVGEPELQRNMTWGSYSAEKNIGDLMRLMGALAELGAPTSELGLSVLLSPNAQHTYVNWYSQRRGAYTTTIINTVRTVGMLVHPDTGFIAQKPGLFGPIPLIAGITLPHEVERAAADWRQACDVAYRAAKKICDDLDGKARQGRDPFDAILPSLEAERPLNEYYLIVEEIRRRMPDSTYPSVWAEAQRALFMFRLGIETAFRQRNLREMLLRLPGEKPRKAAWLDVHRLMEIGFNDSGKLVIRAPRSAFKNATSYVLRNMEPDRPFVIEDNDNFYAEFRSYLAAREILLSGCPDPGNLFVKNMRTRAKDPCLDTNAFYNAFVAAVRRYGIRNPYNGRGAIEGLRPHGPHAGFRDVTATHILKTGGSISMAADALLDTEDMIRDHYARYIPQDRNKAARNFIASKLYGDKR